MSTTNDQSATHARIKAGTLQNLHDAWLWDIAEQQRTQRAATAIGYGLNPYEFARPFPGTSSNLSVVQNSSSGIGRMAAAIAGMAALCGVGASGALLGAWALGALGAVGQAQPGKMTPQEYEVIFESDGDRIAPSVSEHTK